MTSDLKARLDAMVWEALGTSARMGLSTRLAAVESIAIDLRSKLDAAEAQRDELKQKLGAPYRETIATLEAQVKELAEDRDNLDENILGLAKGLLKAEAQVRALTAERDELVDALVEVWPMRTSRKVEDKTRETYKKALTRWHQVNVSGPSMARAAMKLDSDK